MQSSACIARGGILRAGWCSWTAKTMQPHQHRSHHPIGASSKRYMVTMEEDLGDLSIPWVAGKSVYRKLLRAAAVYPSRKRDAIYQDIRADFRDHKNTEEKKLLLRYRSQALSGLAGLEHHGKVSNDKDDHWAVGPVKHADPRHAKDEGTRR